MHAAFALIVLMGYFSCSPLIAQTHEEVRQNPHPVDQLTQELVSSVSSPDVVLSATANAPPHEVAMSAKADPTSPAPQQPPPEKEKPEFEIYGFAMLDMGYNGGQIDPNWFDVVRPTKLPAFHDQFGGDGNFFTGVRQTRFGVKANVPTSVGELKTVFEFELFGVGVDAGQTTFRLRHAYGELGQFVAGQTWSPFMDPDVFPNSIEYWGPNGMVFFRNVQLRWQPVHNENHQVMFALERPGASADLGAVADRDILQGVRFRFPAPDVSVRVRYGSKRTYIQIAGLGRYIAWTDTAPTAATNLTGHTFGWGAHVSSNVGFGAKDAFKWSVIYGHGVENYMNDAPVDIAPKLTTNPHRPVTGDPLPVLGIVAFYDRYWSEKWSTSIGYSLVNIDDVPLQLPDSFRRGQYGLFNLLYYPVKDVMAGGEFQWGRRQNFADGWVYDDYRIQFSFRYNFSFKFGGDK
jgi:DcaP outer membrane protein